MKRALPAIAAAGAVIFALTGFTSCGVNTGNTAIRGPFKTHCAILERGVASVSFRNIGGRNQPLGSFTLDLINKNNKIFHQKPVKLTKPVTVLPGQAQIYRYGIAYNAIKCEAEKLRRK